MTDRLNPEAFLAAKDAAQEACQANKDWHDITTFMLSAYDKSNTAALPTPRTIETVEGLDALPFETIVLDAEDDHMKRVSNGEGGAYWERFGDTWTYPPEDVRLPARVLWVPTEGGGE